MKRVLTILTFIIALMAPARAFAEITFEGRIPYQLTSATDKVIGASGVGMLISYRWEAADTSLGWLIEEMNFTEKNSAGANMKGIYHLDAIRIGKNIGDPAYIAADFGSVSSLMGHGNVVDVACGGRLLKSWDKFSSYLSLELMYRFLDTRDSLAINGTATTYSGAFLNIGVGVTF
ncbi:MAG: hypothetical protein HZA04_00870 [Nitrospinae bacterium]|nr:hypothetical protein [Nitrospinota bacterium]